MSTTASKQAENEQRRRKMIDDAENKALENRQGIIEDLGIEKTSHSYYNSFNRFKNHEGMDFLESGIGYFFFTKPQLNLSGQDESLLKIHYPFIYMYKDKAAYTNMFNGRNFVYPLTNLGTGFDTHDIVMETDEYSNTFRGYKMVAPTTTVKSEVAGDFSINYLETSDMYVTTYHKIWLDYIQGVREGVLKPIPGAIKGLSNKTGKNRTGYIDYMCSVYYFLLDVDGQSIKYWAKYTGVFPTNLPYSTFKWEQGQSELRKMSINYQYNYKEDMNPILLEEFNKIGLDAAWNYYHNSSEHNWNKAVRVVNDSATDSRYKLIFS